MQIDTLVGGRFGEWVEHHVAPVFDSVQPQAAICISFSVTRSFPVRFGLMRVPTYSRRSRGSSEHSPSCTRPDTSLTHSQPPNVEF